MSKLIFFFFYGDFALRMSDDMAMDSDGNLMMRVSDNMVMDMDSGELHLTSQWDSNDDE